MHWDICFHLVTPAAAETSQECIEHQTQGSWASLWEAADSRPCPPPALARSHSLGTWKSMSNCSSPFSFFARQISKGSVSVFFSEHAKSQSCCWEQSSKELYINCVVWFNLGLLTHVYQYACNLNQSNFFYPDRDTQTHPYFTQMA